MFIHKAVSILLHEPLRLVLYCSGIMVDTKGTARGSWLGEVRALSLVSVVELLDQLTVAGFRQLAGFVQQVHDAQLIFDEVDARLVVIEVDERPLNGL